jgi:hypothetical protein
VGAQQSISGELTLLWLSRHLAALLSTKFIVVVQLFLVIVVAIIKKKEIVMFSIVVVAADGCCCGHRPRSFVAVSNEAIWFGEIEEHGLRRWAWFEEHGLKSRNGNSRSSRWRRSPREAEEWS